MIRSGRFVSVLAAALLILMPALSTAQSQATTGVIEGTVSDPSGAPIAGGPKSPWASTSAPRPRSPALIGRCSSDACVPGSIWWRYGLPRRAPPSR